MYCSPWKSWALDASAMQKQQGRPLFFAVFNCLLLKNSDGQNGSLSGERAVMLL